MTLELAFPHSAIYLRELYVSTHMGFVVIYNCCIEFHSTAFLKFIFLVLFFN